jgi:hypothetical protein
MATGTERNKAVVRRLIEEVLSRGTPAPPERPSRHERQPGMQ